jgi:hypothetical protein
VRVGRPYADGHGRMIFGLRRYLSNFRRAVRGGGLGSGASVLLWWRPGPVIQDGTSVHLGGRRRTFDIPAPEIVPARGSGISRLAGSEARRSSLPARAPITRLQGSRSTTGFLVMTGEPTSSLYGNRRSNASPKAPTGPARTPAPTTRLTQQPRPRPRNRNRPPKPAPLVFPGAAPPSAAVRIRFRQGRARRKPPDAGRRRATREVLALQQRQAP